jgi:thiamine biosynthesis lipoprotein
MGTRVRLQLYASSPGQARQGIADAFSRIERLDAVLSDYRETSDLTAFCAEAGKGLVPVDRDLFRLLSRSREWAERTEGLFDITAAPVVQLWRRARRTQQLPAPDRLAAARALVGFEQLSLDPARGMAGLGQPGMRIDLGGIAKGDAADEALAVLASHGIDRALVAVGGDIVVGGPPPGSNGWEVWLASPEGASRSPAHALRLREAAVSTSGDLEQSVTIDGRRYSHIVDPRTGLGVTRPGLVTVLARHGQTADVLATTLNLLGPEEGLPLLERLLPHEPSLAARFVTKGELPTLSPGWPTTSTSKEIKPRARSKRQGP